MGKRVSARLILFIYFNVVFRVPFNGHKVVPYVALLTIIKIRNGIRIYDFKNMFSVV